MIVDENARTVEDTVRDNNLLDIVAESILDGAAEVTKLLILVLTPSFDVQSSVLPLNFLNFVMVFVMGRQGGLQRYLIEGSEKDESYRVVSDVPLR